MTEQQKAKALEAFNSLLKVTSAGGNYAMLTESINTIRQCLAPVSEVHPHSYEKRVLDSIVYLRGEIEKGFYHPDKEPLEVIMYAAEESLK